MKRVEPTIVEKATQTVDGFAKVHKTLQQQVVLRGQSNSTLENYIRRIALISLQYGRLPEDIAEEEINEYLAALASNPKTPSRSTFKHAVSKVKHTLSTLRFNCIAIGAYLVTSGRQKKLMLAVSGKKRDYIDSLFVKIKAFGSAEVISTA